MMEGIKLNKKIHKGLVTNAKKYPLRNFIRQGLDDILSREIIGLCSVSGKILKHQRPAIPAQIKKILKGE